MNEIRKYIENIDLNSFVAGEFIGVKNEDKFKERILASFDKIVSLKDSCIGKKAIVMGLGPSLLDIDKSKYADKETVRIVCNDFHKVENFFDDNFFPDFWCGANSYESLEEPYKYCANNNITSFVTIPKKSELEEFMSLGEKEKLPPITWLWEHKIFQQLLAKKYGVEKTYTHCNTITNHMIAFALWLGCNPIYVTGYDLSYSKSLERTGQTHAHPTPSEETGTVPWVHALDYPKERKQIISDLKYFCKIAYRNDIQICNLSHKENKLPYNLSFRK